MARYFFDVRDGDALTPDETGIECSDLGDMRYKAIDALPEIARDTLPDGDAHMFEVSVRDDQGKPVFRCRLTLTTEWQAKGNIIS